MISVSRLAGSNGRENIADQKKIMFFIPAFSMTDLLISCWSNRELSEKGCHWPDTPSVLGGKDPVVIEIIEATTAQVDQ
jgi:hypothetical protein